MSKRVYKLLNGSELVVCKEVLELRQSPNALAVTVDGNNVIDDVLALVDVGNDAARELEYAKKQAGIWNDEAVRLREELEEAWKTIRNYGIVLTAAKHLSKEIDHTGAPKDMINFQAIAKNMKVHVSTIDWSPIDSL
ncbi:MAG: hypothetical protein ACE3L7_32630 [Candidatus Pristimantibacillus sp.]